MQHHPTVIEMADVMRERAASCGHCTDLDLNAAGFDALDIETHAQAAAKLAAQQARKAVHPAKFIQKRGR